MRHLQISWLALLAGLACMLLAQRTVAQFYPKVDYYDASVALLRDAAMGDRPGGGTLVGSLAALQDPALLPLFEAMTKSTVPAARVYGVVGSGLARGGKSVDPKAILALQTPEERGVCVREANATGLLRGTAVAEVLASGNLLPATTLTLVGELDRRGETWKPELLQPITTNEDSAMAGIASLLMLSKGDAGPWQAFLTNWKGMPEPTRSELVRAMAEGSVIFEIEPAIDAVLAMAATPGVSDDAQLAAVGAALTLTPARGLQAWQDRVAARRTQPQLMRAGLQLLAADEKAIPASAFDQIRNGSAVLEAMANAGRAMRNGGDPTPALIALIEVGHPGSAEWALLRARTLPPEQAGRIWKHVLSRMDAAAPEDRPSAVLVSLAVKELMAMDPAAVRALVERAKSQPMVAVAVLTGVYDSALPEGADIARALRGSVSRAGESLATLILARSGAPLTDDDLDVLGRAAAGGGDLETQRAAQAAWFYIKRKEKTADAFARITGEGK